VLTNELRCKHCGEDLRLYASSRDLPVALYNRARQLWDAGDLPGAAAWLEVALQLRTDLAEAHWLLGAIAARRGDLPEARSRLGLAVEFGAELDPCWLEATEGVIDESAATTEIEAAPGPETEDAPVEIDPPIPDEASTAIKVSSSVPADDSPAPPSEEPPPAIDAPAADDLVPAAAGPPVTVPVPPGPHSGKSTARRILEKLVPKSSGGK
jgi:hypothetical protein